MNGDRNELRFSFIATIDNDEKLLSQGNHMEYHKKHQNIVDLTQETNHGGTYCRKIGVKAARGKYIWIVDKTGCAH